MPLDICTDRQKILDTSKHTLVIGGPGSGKTTIALLKALRRIEAGLKAGQKVLFLSFSRAAVARVAQSAAETIPSNYLQQVNIQTFHSFFWEVVRCHSYLLGTSRKIKLLVPHEEEVERAGRDEEDPSWLTKKETLFKDEGKITFDLFAPTALVLFEKSQKICDIYNLKYPLIIVDEAQDTGTDQWKCVHLLSGQSQLLVLADLEQQIYDFRKDVSPERMRQIVETLAPLQVDLGSQNNRSPDLEIAKFGNDLLIGKPKIDAYLGVSSMYYRPDAIIRDAAIRKSIGILNKKIKDKTGKLPESIAVLASWGKGVQIISKALKGTGAQKEIPHQILVDETQVLIASKLISYCLEPINSKKISIHLIQILEILLSQFQAKGNKTSLAKVNSYKKWISKIKAGEIPNNSKVVNKVLAIIDELSNCFFSGVPHKDWIFVKYLFVNSGVKDLSQAVNDVEIVMSSKRGKIISNRLNEQWKKDLTYRGARAILEQALAEDQLISGNTDLKGITVMTMHKSKGKEFDGVIIFYEKNFSPLIAASDPSPHPRSRKLLRVAVTRAKKHTLLLLDVYLTCPLLSGFQLEGLGT